MILDEIMGILGIYRKIGWLSSSLYIFHKKYRIVIIIICTIHINLYVVEVGTLVLMIVFFLVKGRMWVRV